MIHKLVVWGLIIVGVAPVAVSQPRQRTLGGFNKGLDDYEVRIDYVQRNLSAIWGYYQLLRQGSGDRDEVI